MGMCAVRFILRRQIPATTRITVNKRMLLVTTVRQDHLPALSNAMGVALRLMANSTTSGVGNREQPFRQERDR